jgi:HAD superfamily hydrolase (TIGR01549 family)
LDYITLKENIKKIILFHIKILKLLGDEGMYKTKIYELIDKHKIISFDVFDTLICRDVNNYKIVFEVIEKKLIKKYGDLFVGFAEKRIDAERKTRELINREVTLDEIYANLNYTNNDIIKKIEEETEIGLTSPNPVIIPIYNYCVKNNKTVVVTSDMYLSEDIIRRILTKNGFEGYTNIFVSSEFGEKKRNGKLFKRVVDELRVKPKEILHIGDNIRSDVIFANLSGIKGVQIKNKKNTKYVVDKRKTYNFINNRIQKLNDPYERIGYEIYGVLIVGFLNWCNEELERKGIKKVFFAARDSFVLKEAFEIMYPDYDNTYFKVSRRAVQVPAINFNNQRYNLFLKIASFDAISDVTSIYKRIGLEEVSSSKAEVFQSNIKSFFEQDYVIRKNEKLIFSRAEEERKAMLKYLKNINFNGSVAFIDVGWKCSTQNALSHFGNVDIWGLYLGIHPHAKEDVHGKGYLFDKEYSNYFYTVMGGMSLLEAFFTAPEKSLKKYEMNDSDDDVCFEYEIGDSIDTDSVIFKMHKGAIKFVNDYCNSLLQSIDFIDFDEAFTSLKSIIDIPTKENLDVFGAFPMENEGKISPIIPRNALKGIKEKVKGYGKSGWKIGYLKKLLKFPLPYKTLFELSYNLYKKNR